MDNLPTLLSMDLDLEKINNTQLSFRNDYQNLDLTEFPSYPGKEHYKLLTYLANKVNNSNIIDIGTHRGFSALALSQNKTNIVHSFDIFDKIDTKLKDISNIKFYIENLWDPETRKKWQNIIQNSQLIFLDIDPHDGVMEYEFYCFLRDINFTGLLVTDDIWYFKGMRDNFWYHIPSEHKRDITAFGHWSGTGLICFNEQKIEKSDKNWTFVTGYFDLTVCEDASKSINERPSNFYLEAANTTMGLDVNLVVYCEEKYLENLSKLRPAHLKSKTKYIVCTFDDFPLNKYRNKIIENRKKCPSADDRNTPSYYLFCMARYEMIKRMIDTNPFNSTHFAWINICIERYGYRNVAALNGVINEYRDKFSTCYIDYIPNTLINDLPEYFKWGRCSLCSGFFTGNNVYMRKFCELVEEQFMEYLEKGYGHADEQLYSPIYFKHPEIFEVYYGDYKSMVTNYVNIVEDTETIIRCLINNSFQHKNYDVCYQGCKAIWKYCTTQHPDKNIQYNRPLNTSILSQNDRNNFLKALLISSRHVGDTNLAMMAIIEMKCRELGY